MKLNKLFLFLIFLSLFSIHSIAQIIEFTIPDSVCLNENISIQNSSSGFDDYSWDFCEGDLKIPPTASSKSYSELNIPVGTSIIQANGLWYGFICSLSGNEIVRLDFGQDLTNIDPSITNLGNSGGALNQPQDIKVVNANGEFYAFTYNRGSNQLIRTNFGADLTNINPSYDTLLSGSGYTNGGLDIEFDGSNWVVALTNANTLSLINLGSSLGNIPASGDVMYTSAIPGVDGIGDIKLISEEGNWYGIIVGFNSRTVHRVSFGSSLFTDPVAEQLNLPDLGASGLQPYGITGAKEEGDWIFFLSTIQGSFPRLNFGAQITNSSVVYDNLGNLSMLGNTLKVDMAVSDSRWMALTSNWTNTTFYMVEFPQASCSFDKSYSSSVSDTVQSVLSGSSSITLRARNNTGLYAQKTKFISIKNTEAPSINIITDNVCVANSTNFIGSNNNGDAISSWNWDFGDGNTSTAISPTHQYATMGEYFITLAVENTEGCKNIFYDTLNILPEPQPEFTTTNTQYCTFEQIAFSNTTPFDFGGNVAWSWDFNGEGSSTLENPNFIFESPGTKTITLEANVSGCIKTFQSTLEIIEGPQLAFSYDRNCLGEIMQFTNSSTGANITSYLWDFGNGESSTVENPQIIYNNAGTYAVSLTVSNASGCENTITNNISFFETIVDSIQTTQATENLPFALGIDWSNDFDSTQNLNYRWEINGESQATDTAIYTLGQGNYTVNLEITTENGCLFTAQRVIEVKASEYPTPDFNLLAEVCLGEEFQLENTSVNANSYEWEFCFGDLKLSDLQVTTYSSGNLSVPVGSSFIKFNNQWYGFITNIGNNTITRLDFGDSLHNSPSISNLGNLGGLLSGPQDIKAVVDNGNLFLFVSNQSMNKFIRVNMGADISNTAPSTDILLSGDADLANNGIDVIFDGQDWVAVYTSTNFLRLIRLGNSPSNIPLAEDLLVTSPIAGIFDIGDISFIKDQNDWYAVIVGISSKTIFRLYFGNSVFSIPSTTDITPFELSSESPYGANFVKEAFDIYLFITTSSGNLLRLDFSRNITNTPIFNNLGKFNALGNTLKTDIAYEKSRYFGLTTDWQGSRIYLVDFSDATCDISTNYSTQPNPMIFYPQPGTYPITLTAYHPNGNSASITKEITVTENQAPEIAFATGENLCVSATIQFSSESNTEISSYNWDFGDGNASSEANPAHLFSSAGKYLVQLSVSDTTGCNNLFQDSISVYAEPLPDFQASAQGTICSQKPVVFENTTSLPTTASFQWNFGDGSTSTEENPEHIYASEGEYIINFQIEMAGCLVEKTDTITVNPGPLVDFNYNDDCFGQVVNFENSSTGEFLQSFQWDFGDGTQSTQTSPNHRYDSAGTYKVQLTALTSNGCDYTFEQEVIVHPVATVAFEAEVGCANQPIQFNEQVALQQSNITDYLWDFGVSGTTSDVSTEANPEFTFPSAGTYEVSLQVTTADGCTTSGTQTVSVNALPQPAFRYEDNCLNNAILFSPEITENIVAHFWELQNVAGEVVFTAQSENFSYTFENAGTYQLRYRQQNENLCSNSITETIEILPLPEPEFQVGSICANEPIFLENLTDLKGNTLKSYSWSINEAVVSTDFRPQYTFEESGDYQIALQVETQNGCIQTVEKTISVSPAPVAFFELEQSLAAFPYTLTLSAQSQGQTAVRPAKHNTDTNLITIKSKNSTRRTIPTSPLGTEGLVSPLGTPAKGWPASGRKGLLGTEGLSNFQLPTSNQLTIDNKQLTNRTSQLLSDTILSPFISTYFNNISTKSSAYKHTISSNTQHPTPNTLLPTPNTQHPSSNITWTLNGDTISSSAQLNYVIEQPGTYLLGLILTNEAGCTDSHYEQIRIRKPNLDIALSNLRITQDQDFTGFVLNISNRGTLVPERLDLEIDLGSYAVTETIEEPLLPEQNRNVALSIKLTEEQIRGLAKICIRAIPHNEVANETYENNNRVCTNIETGLTIMEIYPNPVVTQFTLPIILPENAVLSLSLEQSNGQNVKAYSYDLEAGYHEIQLERGNIKPGIYFLRIRYQGKETVKKIIFQ